MKNSITNVLVVGGGVMGSGIASKFIANGLDVQIYSRKGLSYDSLAKRIKDNLRSIKKKSNFEYFQIHSDLDKVSYKNLDIVIESLPEDLNLKKIFFKEITELATNKTIITSNSSGFPISEITKSLKFQQRFYGLHFFMPAQIVPLVEIVCSSKSDLNIQRKLYDWLIYNMYKPIIVKKDLPGFVANRIQAALMREAWHLIEKNIANYEDIDKAVQYGFGFRYLSSGPMMQKEYSGHDTSYKVSKFLFPHLCDSKVPSKKLKELVENGKFGFKSREGLKKWTEKSIKLEKKRYLKSLLNSLKILN